MAKSNRQILNELVAKLTPKVREAFLIAIRNINNDVILKDLIDAIQANNFTRAFQVLGLTQASMRPLLVALEGVLEQGGNAIGATFPRRLATHNEGVRTAFHFDVRNIRAENFLREQSSRLITSIQEDVRVNVMNIMTVNLEVGNNPRVTALDIIGRIGASGKREGGIIGLSQPQELWVRNARRDLETLDERYFTRELRDKRFDSIVRKAIADKKPLPKETVDRLISRYKDGLLVYRGQMIARTETIESLNRSEYEAYKQANDMGAIRSEDITRHWDNAGDSRVRHDHKLMEGQTVGLDEPFTFPDGTKAMFPGDKSLGASASEIIGCRCKVRMNVDWLANVD